MERHVVENKNITSPVLNFFDGGTFTIDTNHPHIVHYLAPQKLPEKKKVIILSATANPWIYGKVYGENINFYDLGNVENAGKIEQDTSYTYSRANLRRKGNEALNYALKLSEDRYVITFQEFKHYFPKAIPEMHFGNTLGMDGYKGKRLAVVGTPHPNMGVYVLFAKQLGLDVKPSDFAMSYQRVSHNGLEFKFMTFEHPELRLIQFHLIEAELRQAIGRARAVREKSADVKLFSGLPLPEATFINQ